MEASVMCDWGEVVKGAGFLVAIRKRGQVSKIRVD